MELARQALALMEVEKAEANTDGVASAEEAEAKTEANADAETNTEANADEHGSRVGLVALEASVASSAEFSESGYSQVALLCCPQEMSRYVERLIADRSFKVCNEGSLQSLVAWYYCDGQERTFSELKEEISSASEGDCAWIGADGCPKMSEECVQFPATAGRRRSCLRKQQ